MRTTATDSATPLRSALRMPAVMVAALVMTGGTGTISRGCAAATDLAAVSECEPAGFGTPIARLSWSVATPPGTAQKIEVTIRSDGFATGQFEASEELPGEQSSLKWKQIHGQALHRWRVLTLRDGQWVSSEIATFQGPLCIFDGPPLLREE